MDFRSYRWSSSSICLGFFAKNSGVGGENWIVRELEREREREDWTVRELDTQREDWTTRELDKENCVQRGDGGGGCEVCYWRSGN